MILPACLHVESSGGEGRLTPCQRVVCYSTGAADQQPTAQYLWTACGLSGCFGRRYGL